MSDDLTIYPVNNNLKVRLEQTFVDVLSGSSTVAAIFGSPEAVNVRRSKDKKGSKRTLPAIAIDALSEQAIPRTNEYHARVDIICATQGDEDDDGNQG